MSTFSSLPPTEESYWSGGGLGFRALPDCKEAGAL